MSEAKLALLVNYSTGDLLANRLAFNHLHAEPSKFLLTLSFSSHLDRFYDHNRKLHRFRKSTGDLSHMNILKKLEFA